MPTSKSAKKSLQARIPRISTRGFYDLSTGRTLKKKSYDLYPAKFFANLGSFPEITIMVHGMRNDKSGALVKFVMAQKRLRQLGYRYPVIGFSYDANIKNAHLKSYELKVIKTAKIIAQKNGTNLARFILDCKKQNSNTKIRLIGHSLGTEVILHAIQKLQHKKNVIDSAYFFGSSATATSFYPQKFGRAVQNVVVKKVLNYYSPQDEVLKYAYGHNLTEKPIGYLGKEGKTVPNYVQKKVKPRNHRFVSYVSILRSFP